MSDETNSEERELYKETDEEGAEVEGQLVHGGKQIEPDEDEGDRDTLHGG